MSDRVYTLRTPSGTTTGKFYTSPYNAVLAGERLRRTMPNPDDFRTALETNVLDIQEIPCDHTVIKDFVTGFVGHIHRNSHKHGFALIEKDVCSYDLLCNGDWVAEVMILYIPPSLDPENMDDLGEPVLRVLTDRTVESKKSLGEFQMMFSGFCDSVW